MAESGLRWGESAPLDAKERLHLKTTLPSNSLATNPRNQQQIIKRYYEHQETIHSNKLSEIVSELWLAEGKKSQDKLWGRAQVALMRMGIDANQVASVVGQRDVESLAKLVSQADAGTAAKSEAGPPEKVGAGAPQVTESRTIRQMQAEKAAEGGYNSLEEPNLKRALRAFRKKLKTLRRDDESRLGNRYVTSGKPSSITAITPPNEYPTPVWSKLVELGRLKRAGKGTFELP